MRRPPPCSLWLLAAVMALGACEDESGTRPFVTMISPDTATQYAASRTGTAVGGRFRDGAVVLWDDSSRAATFVSSTELRWTIAPTDLLAPDTIWVSVRNPAPDTGRSNSVPYFVEQPFALRDPLPEPGAQVNADATIRAVFTRGLNPGTLTAATFAVRDSATGADVAATRTYDPGARTARLTATLEYDRNYQVRVTTGLRSERGDSLPAQASWTFHTPLGRITRLADRAYFPSLALAPNGTLHLAYWGSTPNIDLRLALASCATNCGDSTSWQFEEPTFGGNYVSLGIDGQGRRHVAFQDYFSLKYGIATGNAWQFVTVDPRVETGSYADLEVEADGRVHIVHFLSPKSDLLYATCFANCASESSWTSTPVDTAGNVGAFASLSVGQAGALHVVYHNYDIWDLRYATCASSCGSSTWQTVTIDTAGAVGWGNSLVVDAAGVLHVAGFDHTNGTVRYGRCATVCTNPANWAFSAVTKVANPGTGEPRGFYWVRMSAHSAGITLAFQDRRSGELFTADCSGSCAAPGWTIRRASRWFGLGAPTELYPSLVVDANGIRHIAFGVLRYMRFP